MLECVATGGSAGRQAVVEAGGVDAVLNVMKAHIDDEDLPWGGCNVLCRIVEDDEGRKAVVEAGGVDTVLAVMRAHPDVLDVQQSGCDFLCRMTTDGEGPPNYRTPLVCEDDKCMYRLAPMLERVRGRQVHVLEPVPYAVPHQDNHPRLDSQAQRPFHSQISSATYYFIYCYQ